jgi:hypothetical protein
MCLLLIGTHFTVFRIVREGLVKQKALYTEHGLFCVHISPAADRMRRSAQGVLLPSLVNLFALG